jgi:hypothetical protein
MPQQTNNSEVRHALIRHPKFGFGNVVLHINCQQNAISFFVAANNPPQILRAFEQPDQARKAFRAVVQSFLNYGWIIIHNGRPNFG